MASANFSTINNVEVNNVYNMNNVYNIGELSQSGAPQGPLHQVQTGENPEANWDALTGDLRDAYADGKLTSGEGQDVVDGFQSLLRRQGQPFGHERPHDGGRYIRQSGYERPIGGLFHSLPQREGDGVDENRFGHRDAGRQRSGSERADLNDLADTLQRLSDDLRPAIDGRTFDNLRGSSPVSWMTNRGSEGEDGGEALHAAKLAADLAFTSDGLNVGEGQDESRMLNGVFDQLLAKGAPGDALDFAKHIASLSHAGGEITDTEKTLMTGMFNRLVESGELDDAQALLDHVKSLAEVDGLSSDEQAQLDSMSEELESAADEQGDDGDELDLTAFVANMMISMGVIMNLSGFGSTSTLRLNGYFENSEHWT